MLANCIYVSGTCVKAMPASGHGFKDRFAKQAATSTCVKERVGVDSFDYYWEDPRVHRFQLADPIPSHHGGSFGISPLGGRMVQIFVRLSIILTAGLRGGRRRSRYNVLLAFGDILVSILSLSSSTVTSFLYQGVLGQSCIKCPIP